MERRGGKTKERKEGEDEGENEGSGGWEEDGHMLTLKETFNVNNISLRRLHKVPRLINLASG